MIKSIFRNCNRYNGSKLILIIISYQLLLFNTPIARADNYLRVYKNGVIYYYFSDKELRTTKSSYDISSKYRSIPSHRKLSPQELEVVVREASRHHSVPASLIKAVIKVESNFNPAATSPKGAQGLMQLMPGTAEDLQVRNAYDIRENIWAGTRFLSMLLDKFGYSLPLALAAYNAGPQRVEKCMDIPPIKETQGFVRDVCTNFLQYCKEPSPQR